MESSYSPFSSSKTVLYAQVESKWDSQTSQWFSLKKLQCDDGNCADIKLNVLDILGEPNYSRQFMLPHYLATELSDMHHTGTNSMIKS